MENLRELSQSELQEILEDSQKVEAMVMESSEVQGVQLEREMSLAANRSLAEQNLKLRPQLQERKERLSERYRELQRLETDCRGRREELDSKLSSFSPDLLLSLLQTEGAKIEEESESLAEQFLEGSVSLDSFLDLFFAKRSLAHKRRVRIEKMQEELKNRASALPRQPPEQPAPRQQEQPQQQQQQQPPQIIQQQPWPQNPPNAVPPPSQHAPLPYSPSPLAPLPYSPSPLAPQGPTAYGHFSPVHFPQQPGPLVMQPPSHGAPPYGPPYTRAPGFPPSAGPGAYLGPRAPSQCPYPLQPSFPGGPPQNGAPYPTQSYVFPQQPSSRPQYRPGYGMPQPYS
ncbi:vacuolar protein sorting-associated protein 37C-like [Acipenser ruthenus]|uniref:vacuolar protein sorting-associated protein 37C-like n=1 Tax=Acipenser ruthenus TaxID=7906 RepID=UPI0027421364|nr:vacuolar protein sorting-associated protein 37C-like [Acipenser ruthenus]